MTLAEFLALSLALGYPVEAGSLWRVDGAYSVLPKMPLPTAHSNIYAVKMAWENIGVTRTDLPL